MEWLATAIAMVAALVAGWQAWEARRARVDASKSATEAQQYEARAVAASERIASAIEEQNERERVERERYKNPWTMIPDHGANTRGWKFLLGGEEPVTGVRITVDDQHMKTGRFRLTQPESDPMRPGEALRLDWFRSMASARQISAELHWVRPNGEEHSSVLTLD